MMLTHAEMVELAREKWGSREGRRQLREANGWTISYVSHILSGNRNIPPWMLKELGIKKVVTITYEKEPQNA